MKKFLFATLFCLFALALQAEIKEIQVLRDFVPAVTGNRTLVLIDMDDTATDSTLMLGTGVWRKSLRENSQHIEMLKQKGMLDQKDALHDEMTLYVARRVPVKPVEPDGPEIVKELQAGGVPVFIFTARGKEKWYSTAAKEIDVMTDKQLKQAGYTFEKSILPPEWANLDPAFYSNGVIYTSPVKKGTFIKNLIEETGYRPEKIVFIDDKRDQVVLVEKAAEELGIPFEGFWYTRADLEHQNFNEEITMMQWAHLYYLGKVISDQQAEQLLRDFAQVVK